MALDDILKLVSKQALEGFKVGGNPQNSILDSVRNQYLTTPVSQFLQVEQQNRPNMSVLDDPNFQKFLYALHKVEGGGDQFDVGVVHIPFNRGKLVTTSTARGAFQFIKSTRNSILRRYGVDAWSTDPKEQQMAAIYLLYDKDPEIINRIRSGDLKGAGELVNAGLAEGSELFEGVKNQKETFEAAIDEGNQIKDVEVVNNFEENLIAKREKLNEYANDGSYVYIDRNGNRQPFKQSTADHYTINAYDDVPDSVDFTTTPPDLTVRDLSNYEDYYGEGTTIINANGKDYILVPTDSGEPQQIPIHIANAQLDAGQAIVRGNEQEVSTTTEESDGEYKITPLQEGDEVFELQPNFLDDLRSPEAGRADGTPLTDAEILAEIQKQFPDDDIDVVEDSNGKLVVIKKRPTSEDVESVSGQDNPVPQPNVLDEEGDETVSPVVPDTNTEETEQTQETEQTEETEEVVIDPNDGQEINTEESVEETQEVLEIPEGLGNRRLFYKDGNTYEVDEDGNVKMTQEGYSPEVPENAQPGDLFQDDDGNTYKVLPNGEIAFITPTELNDIDNPVIINAPENENTETTTSSEVEQEQQEENFTEGIVAPEGVGPGEVFEQDGKTYAVEEDGSITYLGNAQIEEDVEEEPSLSLDEVQETYGENATIQVFNGRQQVVIRDEDGNVIEQIPMDDAVTANNERIVLEEQNNNQNVNEEDGEDGEDSQDGEDGDDQSKRKEFNPSAPDLLSSIGGISSLVSALFAKKGLDEALKEVDIPKTPGLSQAFKRHFYESEQLAKSGMSLNEQDQIQKNIDQAYTQGIDKIVRGTSGDRAKFLAGLGVLDAQRNSSLLKAAALNDQIKRQNRQEYTKLLDFKETFETNKSEKERTEELKAALTKQSMYADLSGKAIKNIFDNMTAAKMYGKGSNYDNMMRMQMYNMGFDPPSGSGLPSILQNLFRGNSLNNNNNNTGG
jgi:hypothetical protein